MWYLFKIFVILLTLSFFDIRFFFLLLIFLKFVFITFLLFNLIFLYFFIFFLKFIVVFHLFSLFFTFILAQGERKLLATATRRLGPSLSYANGTLQALPDLFKFLTKTVHLSFKVNRNYFTLAAVYSLVSGYFLWFVWSFGISGSNFLNFDYSFFFFMFVTIVNIYSIILGGFISLSKYAILSSIRVVGQLFSFDIIQNLLMCSVLSFYGTYSFEEISYINFNSSILLLLEFSPLVIVAFIALLMENFRVPFDMSEAEAEVITGYTVEYYGFLFFAFLFSEFLSLWNGIIFYNQIFLSGGFFFF